MPILAAMLATLFTGLMDFLVKFFTRDVALRLAFCALLVGGFATMFGIVQGLLTALAYALPSGLVTVFAFAFPSNVAACVSAALACDAAILGYQMWAMGFSPR